MKKESIEKDLDKIVSISKEFGAIKVLLFGSCLDNINSAHDIDIAVSGIRPRDFFRYYGKVSMEVDDEVDIVDLDDVRKHLHKRFYLKEGFYMKDEYKELREDVSDEEKSIKETLDRLSIVRNTFNPEVEDFLTEPAMGTYLMNFYNGIENILKYNQRVLFGYT